MKPHIVLIHGAWQGSWAWNLVRPFLDAAGFDVHAVDLPAAAPSPAEEISLDLYAAHVGGLLHSLDGPAFVVGHSGGATVACQVAENDPDRVRGLILIAGITPPGGKSFSDITAALGEVRGIEGIWPYLIWNDDRTICAVSKQGAREIFYHDAPLDLVDWAFTQLVPQPLGGLVLTPHLTDERFGRIPRLYVEALGDRSVLLAAQRRMQELLPGARIAQLDTGHAPLLSAPAEVARIIIEEVARETMAA
ncbi:alpha/beta fold hydrolase [Parvibaculum sp.]|uniref:alpha/beta fold hydrolase n=1 Tax=Parvibaculum sp. TaxID=2024848 RepID=UPI0032109DFE